MGSSWSPPTDQVDRRCEFTQPCRPRLDAKTRSRRPVQQLLGVSFKTNRSERWLAPHRVRLSEVTDYLSGLGHPHSRPGFDRFGRQHTATMGLRPNCAAGGFNKRFAEPATDGTRFLFPFELTAAGCRGLAINSIVQIKHNLIVGKLLGARIHAIYATVLQVWRSIKADVADVDFRPTRGHI